MKIERRTDEAIMYLEEQIDAFNSIDLRTEFLILLAEDYKRIILDFQDVQAVDSSGLGKILYFHEQLRNRGGQLIIRNVSNTYIQKLFNLVYLDQIIQLEKGEQTDQCPEPDS